MKIRVLSEPMAESRDFKRCEVRLMERRIYLIRGKAVRRTVPWLRRGNLWKRKKIVYEVRVRIGETQSIVKKHIRLQCLQT